MHSLKTSIIAFATLTASFSGASAQENRSAYNWLDITSSSRIYGLGGMNVSIVEDEVAVTDQNPALLGGEMDGQIAFNYMRYVGDSNFAGARYAHSSGERGAWSASLRYFGYGSIRETLPDGSVVGDFAPKDMAFGGAYSHDITDRLRGGIAINMLYSSYADYTAFALSADIGINYFVPESDLSLSAVLANMGGQLKRFNETYDRLPFDIRLGMSKVFGSFPVRFSVTAHSLTKWKMPFAENSDGSSSAAPTIKDSFTSNLFRHLVFGADLVSSPNFYLGIGYNYNTRTDMATYSRSFLSGWSLAAGLKARRFDLGIAFAQPHTGATTFMVNLTLNMNELLNR